MTVEGEQEVVDKFQPDSQGIVKVKPDSAGKYPEVVPWSQYVGIKESLGHKLDTERAKVSSLEEKLKGAVNQEEFGKVKTELESTKTKLQTTETELTTTKENTLKEKRAILTGRGIPEDRVSKMSREEIEGALVVLQHSKPGPDMGSGGGSGSTLVGTPQELARQAYSKK